MDYPSTREVEMASREEIYRWFLMLPVPKLVREGKGKDSHWVWIPSKESREIIKRVYERWKELGGHNKEISQKIFKEL